MVSFSENSDAEWYGMGQKLNPADMDYTQDVIITQDISHGNEWSID